MGMKLSVKRFDELTLEELYTILKLRVDVFVVEQSCAYPELDGIDKRVFTYSPLMGRTYPHTFVFTRGRMNPGLLRLAASSR
jgi:predicted GNAT family N-acyltransferase